MNRRETDLKTNTDPPHSQRRENAAAATPVALWLVRDALQTTLPSDAVQRLVEHYSNPGDLILAADKTAGAIARQLGRRADNDPQELLGNVRRLPLRPARLALTTDQEARAGLDLLLARVAPGGFIAIVTRTVPSPRLGSLVSCLQSEGLRYWQHIVVADPQLIDDHSAAARTLPRFMRAHRDVLVFRTPSAPADAVVSAARWSRAVGE